MLCVHFILSKVKHGKKVIHVNFQVPIKEISDSNRVTERRFIIKRTDTGELLFHGQCFNFGWSGTYNFEP